MSNADRWYEDYVWRDESDSDYNQYKDVKQYSGEDLADAYHIGFSHGESAEEKRQEQYIDQLHNLLAANVRIMKAEIKKEIEESARDKDIN